jgi:Ca2+-binding RTX toxin-like protein
MGQFVGTAGRDTLTGGAEDDQVQGLAGADSLLGGAGADTIDGGADLDILDGEAGADQVLGGAGDDLLYGGAGDDRLSSDDGADQLEGGAGNDLIDGGAGAAGAGAFDPFSYGGPSDPFFNADAVSFARATGGVTVSLAITGPQDTGDGVDTIVNVESLYGSLYADVLSGDEGRNRLYGYDGDDTLSGQGGDDVLAAQGGNDLLRGGQGDDYLLGGYVSDPLKTGAGDNQLFGEVGNDTLVGGDGRDLLDGGAGNDSLYDYGGESTNGSYVSGANIFAGGAGDDSISAKIFDASVDGGDGDDLLNIYRPGDLFQDAQVLQSVTGGAGDDRFVLGDFNATDRLVLDGGSGANSLTLRSWRLPEIWLNQDHAGPGVVALNISTVTYDNSSTRVHGGDVAETYNAYSFSDWIDAGGGNDTIVADQELYLSGSNGVPTQVLPQGKDTVFGGLGDDTISGMGEEDFLRGGDGDDSLSGGMAFDDLHGNVGNDTVAGGKGWDWVVGGQGDDMLFGDEGHDLVYGQLGQDTLDGGAGDDGMAGGQANDVLSGGDGNDYITGDRGDDTLTGGAGADTFHTFAQAGVDRITDFNAGEGDHLLVDVGSAYTLSQVGPDTVVDMGGGNQAILVGVQLTSLTTGWITGG